MTGPSAPVFHFDALTLSGRERDDGGLDLSTLSGSRFFCRSSRAMVRIASVG